MDARGNSNPDISASSTLDCNFSKMRAENEGAMRSISSSDTNSLLQQSSDRELAKLAEDAEFIKALTKVLNTSLEIAKDFPKDKTSLALALGKKAHSISTLATVRADKEVKVANFIAGQVIKSIGLTKLAGMTPARATAYITLNMADKVVSAAGLGKVDKCKMAVASLAVTTGMAVVGAGTGIGIAIGAIAIAAEAFNVHAQCQAPVKQ